MYASPLTHEILAAAFEVHSTLGPGLLESTYRKCMMHELRLRGLSVSAEQPVHIAYKGLHVRDAYRIDLVVQNTVAVELKAVQHLLPVHAAQLLTQIRLADLRVGLLLNFHTAMLSEGIVRLAN